MALYKGNVKLAGIGVSNGIITSATAPISPVEGMVWYDTTNDVLKSYDGTNWNETGKNYTAGDNISISSNNEISATNTTYTAGTNITIDSSNEISATDTTYSAGTGLSLTGTTFSNSAPFSAAGGAVKVFSTDAPLGTYWNVSSALTWRNAGGQVIFRRSFQLEGREWDVVYYVSYWDPDNKIIHLISFTDGYGAGPEKHVVTYDASGNVTNVTTTSLGGGLQVSPNSPITGIKYVWYGTEDQYAALSQYYTDTPGDTEYHTF